MEKINTSEIIEKIHKTESNIQKSEQDLFYAKTNSDEMTAKQDLFYLREYLGELQFDLENINKINAKYALA